MRRKKAAMSTPNELISDSILEQLLEKLIKRVITNEVALMEATDKLNQIAYTLNQIQE